MSWSSITLAGFVTVVCLIWSKSSIVPFPTVIQYVDAVKCSLPEMLINRCCLTLGECYSTDDHVPTFSESFLSSQCTTKNFGICQDKSELCVGEEKTIFVFKMTGELHQQETNNYFFGCLILGFARGRTPSMKLMIPLIGNFWQIPWRDSV